MRKQEVDNARRITSNLSQTLGNQCEWDDEEGILSGQGGETRSKDLDLNTAYVVHTWYTLVVFIASGPTHIVARHSYDTPSRHTDGPLSLDTTWENGIIKPECIPAQITSPWRRSVPGPARDAAASLDGRMPESISKAKRAWTSRCPTALSGTIPTTDKRVFASLNQTLQVMTVKCCPAAEGGWNAGQLQQWQRYRRQQVSAGSPMNQRTVCPRNYATSTRRPQSTVTSCTGGNSRKGRDECKFRVAVS